MAETAALLADEVLPERPLRQWVLSLPIALRFLLATDPDALTRVLAAVYRTISAYLLKTSGVTRATGDTGAVTLIQRFGSALNLNLNVHFHMILLDGVYLPVGNGPPVFRHVPAPTSAQLQGLVQQIAERIGRLLEKRGLIERDMENAWLSADGSGDALDDLIGHSITYRIAVGPRAGATLFTLQMLPASDIPEAEQQGDHRGAAQAGGFSLHAGIDIEAGQRQKLERLYGVFAPHSKLRAVVTPAGRGKGKQPQAEEGADKPVTARHVAMRWAQRLQRVFGIDIEACGRCGGKLKVIASIEEPAVIAKILAHLERTAPDQYQSELPLGARAPPAQSRLL